MARVLLVLALLFAPGSLPEPARVAVAEVAQSAVRAPDAKSAPAAAIAAPAAVVPLPPRAVWSATESQHTVPRVYLRHSALLL